MYGSKRSNVNSYELSNVFSIQRIYYMPRMFELIHRTMHIPYFSKMQAAKHYNVYFVGVFLYVRINNNNNKSALLFHAFAH